jgi:hypothetical protein
MIHTITWGSVAEGYSFNYKFTIKENYFSFNQYVKLDIKDIHTGHIVFRYKERVPYKASWTGLKNKFYWEEANKKIREIANKKLIELESNNPNNKKYGFPFSIHN